MSASAILRRRRRSSSSSLFYQVGLERAAGDDGAVITESAGTARARGRGHRGPPARTRRVEGFFASVAVLLDRVALIVSLEQREVRSLWMVVNSAN